MSAPATMKAIEFTRPGGAEVVTLVERPTPRPAADEVLIKVSAAGLNRGDIVQRQGFYPPPPGVTDIPGLEVSGHVATVGANVTGWNAGDPVCALLAGGGYAQYAVAPVGQCMPIPSGLTMVQAGAAPETIYTCWTTFIDDGRLKAGETLLIHGGSSGIGTTGIGLAKALGAKVYVTAGSEEKCAACRDLGADLAINYRTEDFVEVIKQAGGGVDVVLDMVGGDYIERDIQIMAMRGRHISIGFLGNNTDSLIPMGIVLGKRLNITGSSLRGRTLAEKAAIGVRLREVVWPMFADGRITSVIHSTFPLAEAADAHRALEAGGHIGKIVLTIE